MINKPLTVLLAIIFLFFSDIHAFSHSGGLDSSGGHTDRKTGSYHYHSKPSQSSSYHPAQTRSVTSTTRTQTTTIQKPQGKIQDVKVVGFMDGDTIKVILNGKETKIRLYGIDTPEKRQAYGKAATDAIKQILTGREIKIKVLDIDKYGRSVAIVYADGKNANEIMVKGGYAWVYRKYCKDSFCNDWLQYEAQAKQSKRTLWKDSNPEPPWDWRKTQKQRS